MTHTRKTVTQPDAIKTSTFTRFLSTLMGHTFTSTNHKRDRQRRVRQQRTEDIMMMIRTGIRRWRRRGRSSSSGGIITISRRRWRFAIVRLTAGRRSATRFRSGGRYRTMYRTMSRRRARLLICRTVTAGTIATVTAGTRRHCSRISVTYRL